MIRVVLPAHLRTLARVDGEVKLEVAGRPTVGAVLDALEARYPMLRGTIRDHVTQRRRAFLRFFACGQDLSHEPADAPLPGDVATGAEPFMVVGAMAGGAAIVEPRRSLIGLAHVVYALHAASLLAGILTAATVVGAFLTGWPSLIAVVLNYAKRGEARGTWLESHFRWQIRTFWFGLLWVGLCLLFVVLTLGIGVLVAWVPLFVVGLWFIYRVVRGWLALTDRRPMYR